MSKKLYIGIAGYMGSGKSTCSKFIAEAYGCKVIDADLEAKKLIGEDEDIVKKLISTFGNEIIDNNTISFKKMGEIVFNDLKKLKLLNSIVHPPLIELLKKKVFEESSSGNVVLDASLIPLWEIEDWFDIRLWITTDLEKRVKRIIAKGSELKESEIRKRAILQMDLFEEPSEELWIYIRNESTLKELKKQINSIFK